MTLNQRLAYRILLSIARQLVKDDYTLRTDIESIALEIRCTKDEVKDAPTPAAN